MNTSTNMQSEAEKSVLDEARKVNEERMAAIEDLAAIVAERIELEERLRENTKEERRAVREAEKSGWTTAQIKRFIKPPRPSNGKRHPKGQVPTTETNLREHSTSESAGTGNVQ